MFEKKILTLAEAKVSGDGPGRISGYASTFGHIDSYGDTIVKGAYLKTIPTFLQDGFIPWGHDWAGYPVATPEKATEDETGLWIEAEFHSDPESQRARALVAERLARGKSMGLSIGYEAKGFDFQEMDGQQVRRLTDINLMEVSLVMVPADTHARVAAIKSAELKRHLNRAQMDRIVAVILEALSADDLPDDDEEALAAAAEAAKSTDPLALDLAGAKLLSDLDAYVTRLTSVPIEDVLAVKDDGHSLIRRLGTARSTLDSLLKRADVAADSNPRELRRQFDHVTALIGPIHGGRRAG